jgi:hypothetical protein
MQNFTPLSAAADFSPQVSWRTIPSEHIAPELSQHRHTTQSSVLGGVGAGGRMRLTSVAWKNEKTEI